MSASTKLVDKLEGLENFRAWKYRIGPIFEENDLARFIKDVPEPPDAATKAKHQKNHGIFYQRSLDSSSVLKEDSKRNV
jgi:hypothetical protein